jgi:D-alanine-D-alanine ligase
MMEINKVDMHIVMVGSSKPTFNSMAKGTRQIIKSLLEKRYVRVEEFIVDNIDDLNSLVSKKPDLVFLGMKWIYVEPNSIYGLRQKVWIANYLEQNDINFTGSSSVALLSEFDKPLGKQIVIDAGLNSSAFFVSEVYLPSFNHNLDYPLFVKPTNGGGSKGIDENSVVYNQGELELKVESIHKDFSSSALIEEYLPGREFSVAVIRDIYSGEFEAMPIEITSDKDINGNSYLTKKIKKSDLERTIAVKDVTLKDSICSLAISVFEALGASDYGRIDLRVDSSGNPSFIEANLMPGLSTHGYLARCFDINKSKNFEEMIYSIVEIGLSKKNTLEELTASSDYPRALSHTLDTSVAI